MADHCKRFFALHIAAVNAIALTGGPTTDFAGDVRMADSILTPAAKDDWSRLLDRIEASIARGLDEAAAQEQALADAAPIPSPEPRLADDRLAGLRAHLDAAGRLAEAVESLLAADEEEARAWSNLAERAAARLASSPTGCL
jgi:hypothetical protein